MNIFTIFSIIILIFINSLFINYCKEVYNGKNKVKTKINENNEF